ncbi:unnamed protein product [Ixodes persulcatus]
MVIIQAFVAKALARSKKLGSNFLKYIYVITVLMFITCEVRSGTKSWSLKFTEK